MENLLIILAVLFAALFVVVPLVEKFAKPVDNEQMHKYTKILGILMAVMMVALLVRSCMGT